MFAKLNQKGNAWNDAAVGVGGTSPSFFLGRRSCVGVSFNVSGNTNITVEQSDKGMDWVPGDVMACTTGDNHKIVEVAAPVVRLKSSAAVTITGTVYAK